MDNKNTSSVPIVDTADGKRIAFWWEVDGERLVLESPHIPGQVEMSLKPANLPTGWDFSYQCPCEENRTTDICYNDIIQNIGTEPGQKTNLYVNFGDESPNNNKKKTYILNMNVNNFGNSESNWRSIQDKIRVYSNAVLKVYGWGDDYDYWKKVIRNTDLVRNVDFSNSVGIVVSNFASNQGRIELYKNRDSSSCNVLPLYRIINKVNKSPTGDPRPTLTPPNWNNVIRDADEILYDLIDGKISNNKISKTNELNIVLDFSNETMTKNGVCEYSRESDLSFNDSSISDIIKTEYITYDNVKTHSYYIKINPSLSLPNNDISWNNMDNIYYTSWVTADISANRKYSLQTVVLVREILHALGINVTNNAYLSETYTNLINKEIINISLADMSYSVNEFKNGSGDNIGFLDLCYNYIGKFGKDKYTDILYDAGYPKSMLFNSDGSKLNNLSFIPMDNIGNLLDISGNIDGQEELWVTKETENILFPLLTSSVLTDNIRTPKVEYSSVIQGILQDLSYNVNYDSKYLLKLPMKPTIVPSNIFDKGSLGDPYVIGLNSNKVWKMPNFDGFSRMLKGQLKGKPIIINVETRLNSLKEALETEEYIKSTFKANRIDYDKLKNSYDFSCKNEAFMRSLWIKYDNKETIVDMENLRLNNDEFRYYKTDEHTSFPKYDIHETSSMLIEVTNGFEIIVSAYPNPQVKTGFRIKNAIRVTEGEGALWNQLFKEDMKLDSLTSEESIDCHENREFNEIKREKYWNSEGHEYINDVSIF